MTNYKRVKYRKSPLLEVIFQLQFPTILAINSNQPVGFQEKIRNRYPFYQEILEQQNELLITSDGHSTAINQTKNYCFISKDHTYKINLTSSFIAISSVGYTQWEDFIEHIKYVVPLFEEEYMPTFYTRVGLRYIDAITRSKLGLSGQKWSDLIQPQILGIITPEIEDGIQSFVSSAEYKNSDGCSLTRTHIELVHVDNDPELSLLMDCDYFTNIIIEKDAMLNIANRLHQYSSNFINNAITDILNEAMEPMPI